MIGAHSLSELDWTTFRNFENVACKSPAVFCATHRSRPSVEFVEKKLNLIAQRFDEDRRFLSENGQVANILFRSKSGGAQEGGWRIADVVTAPVAVARKRGPVAP